MNLDLIFSFILGFAVSSCVASYIIIKNKQKLIEEDIEIKTKLAVEIEKNKTNSEIIELVKKEFTDVATKVISNEQNTLLMKNQEAVNIILTPLNKQLSDFKEEIDKYRELHTKNTGELTQKLSDLTENSVKLKETAQNLSEALTKNKNVKGWYGEDLAKTILEKSGLIEGIHFDCQFVGETKNENDELKKVRPDFVIYLPDNRNLVIDSKAVLSSIINLNDLENDNLKIVFDAVKSRIDELSKKNYEKITGLKQPDFIIMYIPVEPIINLLYTTKEGMNIIDYSRANNIIVTGSVSLITIINLIEKLWKENDRIKNIDNIIETGKKLYEAVATHAEEIIKIQKAINDAKVTTDETIKRFYENTGMKLNIFKEAKKLAEYGITPSKEIPANLESEATVIKE